MQLLQFIIIRLPDPDRNFIYKIDKSRIAL